MNIFNKSGKEENLKYATTARRGTAVMIDIWIVLFLRIFTMQLMGSLWLNAQLVSFLTEFSATFGTQEIKATPEHINFLTNHSIFWQALLFYFIIMVGATYHAYLNSSKWQATIGKRIMKIMVTTKLDLPITIKRGFLHYFLSVMPFVYISYVMTYMMRHDITMSEAILGSPTNLILGVIFVAWIQIQAFSPRKTTAYDLICNINFINGKTGYKLPWSK
jgi:uncharacterized RDD family membrane protein YckC